MYKMDEWPKFNLNLKLDLNLLQVVENLKISFFQSNLISLSEFRKGHKHVKLERDTYFCLVDLSSYLLGTLYLKL